ncbi:MAG: hypothetical protein LWX70_00575 [Sphingobacteriia bacterium]|nr:hypothetical protein [Sphingobacteriia bacterium]
MKTFCSILLILIATHFQVIAENDSLLNLKLNQAFELKESGLKQIEAINDSMKGASYSNLIGLLNNYKLVATADSTINVIYADMYTNQRLIHKNLIIKLDSLGINPDKPNFNKSQGRIGWSHYGFFTLLILISILSLIAIKLFMKQKKLSQEIEALSKKPEPDETLKKINEEYEQRLQDISGLLTEMTLQHNNTATEIENLNKVLAKERQTRIAYSEQYEKVADELNKLKARNDLWPTITGSGNRESTEHLNVEIEKLQIEINDLKAGKFALEQQLKEALLKLNSEELPNLPDPRVINSEFQENDHLKQTVHTLRASLKESVAEGENLKIELASLQKEIEILNNNSIVSAQNQNRIEQLEEELKQKQSFIDQLRALITGQSDGPNSET